MPRSLHSIRSKLTTLLISITILVAPATAHAAFWQFQHGGFVSYYTCRSRGLELMEMGVSLSWRCAPNDAGRYDLWILKRQPGDPVINGHSSTH